MGSAPEPRQHPAMPTPHRMVSRSYRLLRRLGMTDVQAYATIAEVARTVRYRTYGAGRGFDSWLSTIAGIAEERLETLNPSNPSHQGDDHGDGSSSRTSGPAGQSGQSGQG